MAAVAWQETCNFVQAQYRIWAQALLTNMIASGLVQTSDTGQVNPTTITIDTDASATGTKQEYGYLVFKFNDSLAASYPIFIKVTFCAFAFSSTAASKKQLLSVQIGFATDGAGNITGPSKTINETTATGSFGQAVLAGPQASWCHHKEGMLALVAYRASLQFSNGADPIVDTPLIAFVIERTRDSSGNPTGTGVYILGRGGMFTANGVTSISLATLAYALSYFPQLETSFLSPGLTNVSRFGALWAGGEFSATKSAALQVQDILAPHDGGTTFKSVKMYVAALATPGDTADITIDGVSKRFLFAGSLGFLGDLRVFTPADQPYQRMGLAIEWTT